MLDLPEDRKVVMYCGHFYEKKGVQHLVEVARHLPDVSFCLVGGWPKDIARLKSQSGDLTNVIFPGFVSHGRVPTFLAAADLLVLPNSGQCLHAHRTCPLKLFEYAGANRPIVASRIPGIESLVNHGQQAWLTEPDSPQDLLAGIRRVLEDDDLATRLAKQANSWVRQYEWDKRAHRILQHVNALENTQRQGA
ncbi:MAG: glycosyltransferase family 4 protein [Rhodobacteraceae bacterium]|nr:glycosyltransferase family 4 protein [Paracoccaceae bacterium]